MRGKIQIPSGNTPTEIVSETGWTKGIIINNSDSTVYVQWTWEPNDPLTVDNGFPLEPGQSVSIDSVGYPAKGLLVKRAPVLAIHAASGNKELRYVFE